MSGMSATTGVRHIAMLSSRVLVQATNTGRAAAMGIIEKATAAIGAPIRIKGMRLPMGVRSRSDHAPTGGWMKKAAMLSRVMKKPIQAGLRLNLFAKNKGTKAL